ncbi:MAG: apolipoprotein N-acyltransferase [Thalassospira sp.]|uniref:apolipoprotein N-acyltransferase n=2 Tax=Thalassospira sp. TaxID=1912094 RepID=UPI001B2E5E07|nr:apolipoprotein N-acyltransferase [Thalassospira sp.]MBO6806660.1 apolipoprotein N-acyltransferase [Thalassospira sp.]MBO6840283.1 apolipoprotein N-acyltransferase [Thalassospira sp.]
MIEAMARRLAGLSGWRRRFVWLLSGAVAVLALPPFFVIPVLPVCFAVLLWSLEGVRCNKGALSAGWWFGTGHFAAGFYWVSHAFLVQPEIYGWMIPFALLGLGGGLAIFPMLAVWASWRLGNGLVRRAILLAVFWAIVEYLRGHLLTGFPWNLLGHVWAIDAAPMQFASVVGIYGLSFVTALFATLPAAFVAGKRGKLAAIGGVMIAVALWGGGAVRLMMAGPDTSDVVISDLPADVPILQIVQPNTPQRDKWRPELQNQHFSLLLEMSRRPEDLRPDQKRIVIWPETAATFFVETQTQARMEMAEVLGPDDILITGAPRTYPRDTDAYKVWNAIQVIDASGSIVASFDKFHLVPFGEYVPFRSILPFPKLTEGRTDFSSGPGPQTLSVSGIPSFSPLICYEVIFPGAVIDDAKQPDWLLNVTNDGWFGRSAGPYQHMAAARFRTVEEGRPLVRAAYTGVSVVFDSYGRKVASLSLGERATLLHPLLSDKNHTTVYYLWRDFLFYGIVTFFAVLAMGYKRRLKSL